jgi:hypothetical protein
LAENRTITVLRSGCLVQLAKTSRSPTSAAESIFARFPGILVSTLNLICKYTKEDVAKQSENLNLTNTP